MVLIICLSVLIHSRTWHPPTIDCLHTHKRQAEKDVVQGSSTTLDSNVDDYEASKDEQLEGETCSNDRYGEAAKHDNYVWNDAYDTWEYKAPKRVRNKSMSNKQQSNWVLGMRRNWENQNQAERIAKIKIKRDKINMVTMLHCACKHASLYLCIIVQLLVSCVAGVPQIVRGWGVHCRRFF
jgi:hypothetical protein